MLTVQRGHTASALVLIISVSATATLSGGSAAQRAFAQPAGTRHVAAGTSALRGGALATFAVRKERFKVWVTNRATIQQLRDLRAGTSQANIPNGRILAGPGKAGHNRPWRWHLDPRDIQMVEVTTEVCDGTPSYVNSHVGEFVSTVKRYCPWSAKLVALKVIPPVKQVVLAAPADLRILSTTVDPSSSSARKTTVQLAWQDRSSNEGGFRIHLTETRFYGGQNAQTQDEPANATTAEMTFVAGGINPAKEACFTVTAFNGVGESPPAGPACVQP